MSWGRLFQMWGPKCEKVRNGHGFCGWSVEFWACVCLTKSGESGKDCKGVAAQKDKRERNLWFRCKQAVLYLSVQKLGASGVAVGEVCSFDGVELWEWGVQQYFGLSALVELQSLECPWKESCSSLVWTIHKKLQIVLLHLLWGTYGWSWCVLVNSRLFDMFWLRVASLWG